LGRGWVAILTGIAWQFGPGWHTLAVDEAVKALQLVDADRGIAAVVTRVNGARELVFAVAAMALLIFAGRAALPQVKTKDITIRDAQAGLPLVVTRVTFVAAVTALTAAAVIPALPAGAVRQASAGVVCIRLAGSFLGPGHIGSRIVRDDLN